MMLLPVACAPVPPDMAPPQSPELSGSPKWGVVTVAHARVYRQADRGSSIGAIARLGDVASLDRRSSGSPDDPDTGGIWYHVTGIAGTDTPVEGWIEAALLHTLPMEIQARELSRSLRETQTPSR